MIERQITLADERVFLFHEVVESIVDKDNKKLYVITASKDYLENPEYVRLAAVISFDEWSPDLLQGLDQVIETADLKLFNGIVKVVVESIDALKAAKIKSINIARDMAEKGGFTYMGRPFDSDIISVNRINTTANAAMACIQLGIPFSVIWRCADNTDITLDAAGMIGMPLALAQYGETVHYRARELKERVDAITSTDIEEVKALLAEIPDS